MNKFINRAQQLGRKAAELRQAVQGLPAQAAQIRDAVTMTGGELKQLRADVQSNIHSLRADSEDRLLRAMREINDHTLVLEEAGYELTGMDLDLALNQRLAVHLDRFDNVPLSTLRSLSSRQSTDTVRSIIAGIIKAEETAANVELSHLQYDGLIIHIGVVPMIRMVWRIPETPADSAPIPLPDRTPEPERVATPSALPAQSSMFDLRPMPAGSIRVQPKDSDAPAPPHIAPGQPGAVPDQPPVIAPSSAWSHDALARFKKMPGASKYSR